jgi:hypothetical protein
MYADGNARVAVKTSIHDDGLTAVNLLSASRNRREPEASQFDVNPYAKLGYLTCQDEVQV